MPKTETIAIDTLENNLEALLDTYQISRKPTDKKFAFKDMTFALDYQKEYQKQTDILNEIYQLDDLLEEYDTSKKRFLEIETIFSSSVVDFVSKVADW